ncbi:hypothetical protein [Burkholderia alba]|uniref:hypothetical protein n=1 Tax=Burkholderia alba TaxID=2683677 RepID=UPI002B053F6C|nr:hypothetical protein [Burkholderia alba]
MNPSSISRPSSPSSVARTDTPRPLSPADNQRATSLRGSHAHIDLQPRVAGAGAAQAVFKPRLGKLPGASPAQSAHLASSVEGYRALAAKIDFKPETVEDNLAELGHLVENFTGFLESEGKLKMVDRNALARHFARDQVQGDEDKQAELNALEHGSPERAQREGAMLDAEEKTAAAYIATTNSLGFTASHLKGEIYAANEDGGAHYARHEVLHLLSAEAGKTRIQAHNNNLNEAVTETITRLIERQRGIPDEGGAYSHAYPAMTEVLMKTADSDASIKAGMLSAYVHDKGTEAMIAPMAARWVARDEALPDTHRAPRARNTPAPAISPAAGAARAAGIPPAPPGAPPAPPGAPPAPPGAPPAPPGAPPAPPGAPPAPPGAPPAPPGAPSAPPGAPSAGPGAPPAPGTPLAPKVRLAPDPEKAAEQMLRQLATVTGELGGKPALSEFLHKPEGESIKRNLDKLGKCLGVEYS